jgi:uncharacterized repeat protein (TIGR03943 family)
MNRTIHRVAEAGRAAVILSWALFLAFSWYTTEYPQPGKPGRLGIINPSYRWLSLASSAALVLVGAALLSVGRDEHGHRPGGGSGQAGAGDRGDNEIGLADSSSAEAGSPGELVFQALFLAPIVLSLCSTGNGLSGASLSRRGVHEIALEEATGIRAPAPAARGRPAAIVAAQPPSAKREEAQPPLSMADLYDYLLAGAPAEAVGRPVDALGQYFVDERCGENQFIVTRIVVTCCLADAEVIGVRAESATPFQPDLRESQQAPWIRVRGTLQRLSDRFGNPALFIAEAAVSKVPPPDNILLYPSRRRAPW